MPQIPRVGRLTHLSSQSAGVFRVPDHRLPAREIRNAAEGPGVTPRLLAGPRLSSCTKQEARGPRGCPRMLSGSRRSKPYSC